MKFVATDKHQQHDPQFFLVRGQIGRSAEQPERAQILKTAAVAHGLKYVEAQTQPRLAIEAVHTAKYLDFLQTASRQWQALPAASPEVVANVHPNRIEASYPKSIVGRAGWHMADTACPIGPATYSAAIASAEVALTAAQLVRQGEPKAYALCRPPGHHAYQDMAGGFCFLNNSAIAAQCLRQGHERVAVFDIDVHHGNGTQEIFYERGDVLTISVHADPEHYYPFFWGHAHETGRGPGNGANLNVPLDLGEGDTTWLNAIDKCLERIARFDPDFVVLALGLDAHEHDPLQGLSVTTSGFKQAGQRIGSLSKPTLVVQEGGYLSPDLGLNLQAFLEGFA